MWVWRSDLADATQYQTTCQEASKWSLCWDTSTVGTSRCTFTVSLQQHRRINVPVSFLNTNDWGETRLLCFPSVIHRRSLVTRWHLRYFLLHLLKSAQLLPWKHKSDTLVHMYWCFGIFAEETRGKLIYKRFPTNTTRNVDINKIGCW